MAKYKAKVHVELATITALKRNNRNDKCFEKKEVNFKLAA